MLVTTPQSILICNSYFNNKLYLNLNFPCSLRYKSVQVYIQWNMCSPLHFTYCWLMKRG